MKIQVSARSNQILYTVYTVVCMLILIPLLMMEFLMRCITFRSSYHPRLTDFVNCQLTKIRFWITGIC